MSSTTNTYDEFASEYAEMMDAQEQAGVAPDSNMARFLEVIGDVSGLTVLDAGCGEGYLSRILAQRGAQVTGIDISPRLVEIARAKDPVGATSYQVADLSQPLPAYQAHFDLIASYFVLNDVYDRKGALARRTPRGFSPSGQACMA
jgi:2-polyprenyl-3-methyl-5-hydroxy-6-metoxy-1,4-benzoquinol methylase